MRRSSTNAPQRAGRAHVGWRCACQREEGATRVEVELPWTGSYRRSFSRLRPLERPRRTPNPSREPGTSFHRHLWGRLRRLATIGARRRTRRDVPTHRDGSWRLAHINSNANLANQIVANRSTTARPQRATPPGAHRGAAPRDSRGSAIDARGGASGNSHRYRRAPTASRRSRCLSSSAN